MRQSLHQSLRPSLRRVTAASLRPSRRRTLVTVAATGVMLSMSACGAIAEKITEEGAERIIEAETGENVELDIGGDGISVQSEEGSFALNEDGEFVVTDADGSVFRGSANDSGLTVTDSNGEQVLAVDADGDAGEITLQDDNGEAIYRIVTDIPAEWPGDIPRPDGLVVEGGSFAQADGETLVTLIGAPNGSAIDFTDAYVAAVISSGFTETGRFDHEADGAVTAQRSLESDGWTMNVNGYVDDSTNIVNLSIVSKN